MRIGKLRYLLRLLDPLRVRRARNRLAQKYLKGRGLEIGALHRPVRVPPGTEVLYVDVATREESIAKFPTLNPDKIVPVHYISDGFRLDDVPGEGFDFLIANHVLEHSPNPIGTLLRWHRVLKPGGLIFCSVPQVDWDFDRGRSVTTYEHMREDYEAYLAGDTARIRERNREHYLEWLRIAEPAILKRAPLSPGETARKAEALLEVESEIHFHTFTYRSAADLFGRVGADMLPDLRMVEVVQGRGEIVAILEKTMPSGAGRAPNPWLAATRAASA